VLQAVDNNNKCDLLKTLYSWDVTLWNTVYIIQWPSLLIRIKIF